MSPDLVWRDDYPDSVPGQSELVEEYNLFSRYTSTAERLRERGLPDGATVVSQEAADATDLRRCCSERRLRAVCGHPPSVPDGPDEGDPEVYAEALACGGTLAAAERAWERETDVYHLGGGFHHAHRGGSSARTYFNDIVLATEWLRERDSVDRVAIVDLDVHHPDGTRAVYRLDPDVYLFSMHGWNIHPGTGWIHETGRGNADGNHLNVPLSAGIGDDLYTTVLQTVLPTWLDYADPDIVVYQSGADPLRSDPLGNLGLSTHGLLARDRVVFSTADVPVVAVAGGGYGPDTPRAFANTVSAMDGSDSLTDATDARTGTDAARRRSTRWLVELADHVGTHHGIEFDLLARSEDGTLDC